MVLMVKKGRDKDGARRARGTRSAEREIRLAQKREYPAIQEW